MPTAAEYAEGFNLHQGIILAGYLLSNVEIEHKQIVRWNEYEYPTTLIWQWMGSGTASEQTMQDLFREFTQWVSGIRIIRTQSNRPYKCLFQYPPDKQPQAHYSEDYTQIIMEYKGFAKRIGEKAAAAIQSGKAGW